MTASRATDGQLTDRQIKWIKISTWGFIALLVLAASAVTFGPELRTFGDSLYNDAPDTSRVEAHVNKYTPNPTNGAEFEVAATADGSLESDAEIGYVFRVTDDDGKFHYYMNNFTPLTRHIDGKYEIVNVQGGAEVVFFAAQPGTMAQLSRGQDADGTVYIGSRAIADIRVIDADRAMPVNEAKIY